ncbi:unnamed protein product [Symbiodinium necroappetens]|uniref:Fe2OG dioxygenase domain-containing protein n=1 Tax=Symbiodinium necroappetens TaxID=1628268 RepID=A0A813BYL1_9DINO|nr:unnamed protein product [Symbiodinium necroappetens]
MLVRLLATSAGLCGASLPEAGAKPKADVKTLQEVEQATSGGKYPRAFPHGVLNAEWSNDRKILRKLRKALRMGKPFVIKDFLFGPVAEALLQQLQQLSDRQDDEDEEGYPFQRLTEGPFHSQPRGWAPLKPNPCTQVVSDFLETRKHRFAFTGHILIGRTGDKHNAWHSAFRQAMEHPAVVQFWQALTGMPKWVTRYDPSWSWLRPGDYYGLHADDAQARYLALTIHLASGWSAKQGGELVWCGPEGNGDVTIEAPDRPHFHKSFNVSKGGSALLPSFNVAVIFPVFQNSYHAVAPVRHGDGKGRRFTLQGWYVDPCQLQEAKGSCMPDAMRKFKEWSEKIAAKSTGWGKGPTGLQRPKARSNAEPSSNYPAALCAVHVAVLASKGSMTIEHAPEESPERSQMGRREGIETKGVRQGQWQGLAGGGAAAEAEKATPVTRAPTCEWVEEKTDEGKVAYRNGRTGEVVEELPDGVTAADVQKAVPDGSSKADALQQFIWHCALSDDAAGRTSALAAGKAASDYGSLETGSANAFVPGPGQAIETEESKAAARAKPSWKDLPPLLLPWILFGMVLLATALVQGQAISLLASAACFLLSVGFLLFSRGPAWRVLAVSCFCITLFGIALGQYDKIKYLYPYYFFQRSPGYSNVDPMSKPGSVADAGYVSFQPGAHVDTSRGVGFVSGTLWCAAPVVMDEMATSAGYWAVGTDCCKRQGSFECGDAQNRSVRSGVVIQDSSPILEGELPKYIQAARMAAETYGINMPRNPMFIRWNDTPERQESWFWSNATNFVLVSLFIFFLLTPCLLLVFVCTGFTLFGMEDSPQWHPEKLDFMTFGFDWTSRVYPSYIRQDLLYGRTFWTGEVIEDYVFHAANRHVYLGILFCHPAHPYSKWQRLVVAISASCISWFIVTAVAAFTGQTALRIVTIIVLCLVTRNTLKLVLLTYGIGRDFGEAHVIRSSLGTALSVNALGILVLYLVMAASALGAASALVSAAGAKSIGEELGKNVDVLAYMYVLDFLVDAVTPYVGLDELSGVWAFGFFGRWRDERDEFEAAKANSHKFRWTSLGAEVLGMGPSGSAPKRGLSDQYD